MLERTDREQAGVVPKYSHVIATQQLAVSNQRVRISTGPATGAIVITLPRVAEARGLQYFFVARVADVVNTATITHDNDSECWEGDITIDGKCDRVILYSDGQCWWQCCATLTFASSASASPSVSPSAS